ncbi:MAG: ABC transporter substrate-binding protein [Methylocella sp.]
MIAALGEWMKRRDFIVAGGATVAWPLAAGARQPAMPVIGVLLGMSESNPEHRSFFDAFIEELTRLGWKDGRTARIEQRWANADSTRRGAFTTELVALRPDVILSSSTPVTAALQRETSIIPIVFTLVSDPVGAGFVASLPRPGGNITGFSESDPALGGKWLSLLREAVPGLKRVATMFNPDTAPGHGRFFMPSFEAAAHSLAIEPVALPVRSDAEMEAGIAALGRERGGLVIGDDIFMAVHYRTALSATARNNVPAIAFTPQFGKDGGLMAYNSVITDQFRGAAGYVGRILHGEKPSDLPVQMPAKFSMIINLKTAKAFGLNISPGLLATADEVIE